MFNHDTTVRFSYIFLSKKCFLTGSILAMVMPSKPAPAVQKLHAAEPREDEEADDVVFKLPPGASRNTRRVARYLQKDLHFPELLLMLIFMVSIAGTIAPSVLQGQSELFL